MKMKATHWLAVGLFLIGGLYVWHMYAIHGSVSQSFAGLGVGRNR